MVGRGGLQRRAGLHGGGQRRRHRREAAQQPERMPAAGRGGRAPAKRLPAPDGEAARPAEQDGGRAALHQLHRLPGDAKAERAVRSHGQGGQRQVGQAGPHLPAPQPRKRAEKEHRVVGKQEAPQPRMGGEDGRVVRSVHGFPSLGVGAQGMFLTVRCGDTGPGCFRPDHKSRDTNRRLPR